MSRGMRVWGSVGAAALVLAIGAMFAAGQKESKPAAMPPEMAAYMKLAQPGEHHKQMAKMVGTWKVHAKSWMAANAPPVESDGTATVKPVLGGRFFLSDFEGAMMGQPFQGLGLDGYDNGRQKHVGVWADSMGTMIAMFEGNCSNDGKVVDMRSNYEDPLTHKPTYMRTVTTQKSDDTVVMEGFGPGPDGAEIKMMELTYTRNR